MQHARTPIEEALWASGKLDTAKQAVLDAHCRGLRPDLPSPTSILALPDDYGLLIDHGGSKRRTVTLPPPPGAFRRGEPDAVDTLYLLGPDFARLGESTLDRAAGLTLHRGHAHALVSHLRREPVLGWGPFLPAALAAADSPCGPLDLLIRPPGTEALVIDRSLGLLYHVDVQAGEVLRHLKVRIAGKAAPLGVAWIDNRVFCADSLSETLSAYDLRDGASLPIRAATGRVVSVTASPDGLVLYLLSALPECAITAVDADTLEPLWRSPLKGEPCSRIDGRPDAVCVSPDGRQLAVLTAVAGARGLMPILSGLDARTGRAIRTLRLSAGHRPRALAFGVTNPYHVELEPLETALVRLGYVTAAELAELQSAVLAAASADSGEPVPEAAPQAELAMLAGGGAWRRADLGPAESEPLPLDLEPMIAEFLQKCFKEQTGHDVQSEEPVWARVTEAATAARERLERHGAVEVVLSDLIPPHDLRVIIGRDQVREWLQVIAQVEAALMEALEEVEETLQALPDKCPACSTVLLGRYRCPACGHQVLPEPAVTALEATTKPQERPKPTTTDARLFLPAGHLLVADPPRQRVIELDAQGRVVWSIQADRSHADLERLMQWPVDALRLPGEHTMIVDRVGRRVFEVTEQGRPYWEWPIAAGELREPIRVARSEWGETLIVDRLAHRIWRADANGEPLPGYGSGKPGIRKGELASPTDLQVLPDGHLLITDSGNHRVIEIADGEIVWQFGNLDHELHGGAGAGEDQLQAPRRALRVEAGRMLILDAGNHRILLLDRSGQLLWQYDTLAGDDAIRMERPTGIVRLPGERIAYWDTRCLVEIDRTGAVLAVRPFAELETNERLRREQADAERREGQARRLWQVRRLSDDDPERQAWRTQVVTRRQGVEQVRRAWQAGNVDEVIRTLRALAAERLAAARTARTWGIDYANVQRLVADNTDKLMHKRAQALAARLGADLRARPVPPPSTPESVAQTTAAEPLPLLCVLSTEGRIVHLDRQQGVLWTWGEGLLEEPQSAVLVTPDTLLVADTGNHRVLLVAPTSGEICWQSPDGLLQLPTAASMLPNGHVLIADSGNRRVVELSQEGTVVWEWGGDGRLRHPVACGRTVTGHTLVTDRAQHVVLEVAPTGDVVWSYGKTGVASRREGFLSFPAYAIRRDTGHTLIVDRGNDRIVEVDAGGTVVWRYADEGVNRVKEPTFAIHRGRSIWVAHSDGRMAFELSRAGEVLWRIERPV